MIAVTFASPASMNSPIRFAPNSQISAENEQTKAHGHLHRPAQPRAHALLIAPRRSSGDEGGNGVAKVLHRQIGKGVDLYRRGKGGHHRGAKAVHQPLHHEDAQIHDRLLDTGQRRKAGDLLHAREPHAHALRAQVWPLFARVEENAHAGDVLRDHRRLRPPGHAALEPHHEPEVEADVHHRRDGQKDERRSRIAHRAQKRRVVVVQKDGRQAREDDQQVFAHQAAHRSRHAHKVENLFGKAVYQRAQKRRHRRKQGKRGADASRRRPMSRCPKQMENTAPLPATAPAVWRSETSSA